MICFSCGDRWSEVRFLPIYVESYGNRVRAHVCAPFCESCIRTFGSHDSRDFPYRVSKDVFNKLTSSILGIYPHSDDDD